MINRNAPCPACNHIHIGRGVCAVPTGGTNFLRECCACRFCETKLSRLLMRAVLWLAAPPGGEGEPR